MVTVKCAGRDRKGPRQPSIFASLSDVSCGQSGRHCGLIRVLVPKSSSLHFQPGGEEFEWKISDASWPLSFLNASSVWSLPSQSCSVPAVSDVTRILQSIDSGDPKAAEELLPLVYDELRRLAAIRMADEQPDQTLQPTALVHEAWLRLTGDENQQWNGRAHFYGAAAEAMRRILIERARRKLSLKRGAKAERVDLNLDLMEVATQSEPEAILALTEALGKLATEDPESAKLVKLRFFAGMSNQEAAQALGVSERSAKRYWTFARAWLFQEITCSGAADGGAHPSDPGAG